MCYWHPLKGPCQEKTPLQRKKWCLFFAGTSSSTRSVLCRCLHPGFQNLLVRILIRSATRHPSGSRSFKKNKIGGCVAERPSLSRSEATLLIFLTTPGPVSGPQKNIGTLSCPMGCDKIKGSKRANHSGLMTRADHEKGDPPGFLFKGVQRCANQDKGFLATTIKGSPLQSPA